MSSGSERRRSRRRPILETFSVFMVVPAKGAHRLKVRDISDLGVGFEIDVESETPGQGELSPGDSLEGHLYLNQSLALPLQLQVARIEQQNPDGPRLVGATITNPLAPAYRAFAAFIQLLDAITEVRQDS